MTIPPTDKKRNRPTPTEPQSPSVETSKRFKEETPTEEEVDQFFAILTKMHVAVKHFETTTGNGGWRKALEHDAVELTAAADVDLNLDQDTVEIDGGEVVGGGFLLDLNAAPIGDDLV